MDPFILTKFVQSAKPKDGNSLVSLVMFEWGDAGLIGRPVGDDPGVRRLIPF